MVLYSRLRLVLPGFCCSTGCRTRLLRTHGYYTPHAVGLLPRLRLVYRTRYAFWLVTRYRRLLTPHTYLHNAVVTLVAIHYAVYLRLPATTGYYGFYVYLPDTYHSYPAPAHARLHTLHYALCRTLYVLPVHIFATTTLWLRTRLYHAFGLPRLWLLVRTHAFTRTAAASRLRSTRRTAHVWFTFCTLLRHHTRYTVTALHTAVVTFTVRTFTFAYGYGLPYLPLPGLFGLCRTCPLPRLRTVVGLFWFGWLRLRYTARLLRLQFPLPCVHLPHIRFWLPVVTYVCLLVYHYITWTVVYRVRTLLRFAVAYHGYLPVTCPVYFTVGRYVLHGYTRAVAVYACYARVAGCRTVTVPLQFWFFWFYG